MGGIKLPVDNFSINKFWEKTPTALKYILVFVIFLSVFYFMFTKNERDNNIQQIESMRKGINATYELIDNFEKFREDQDTYNKEILDYLNNLHTLVEELNINTNRKLDMILNSGGKNSENIIEKILILNESFERLSKAYQREVKTPNLEDSKITYRINAIRRDSL